MNEAEKPMEAKVPVSGSQQENVERAIEFQVGAQDAASDHTGSEQDDSGHAHSEQLGADAQQVDAAIEPEVQIVSLEMEAETASVEVEPVAVEPVEWVVDAETVEPLNLETTEEMEQASRAELVAQNTELLGWINELERSLAECQRDFKSHLKQFGQQEELLESRTRELIASQEQTVQLTREVESLKKEGQRKRILAETLTAQLETGQERIAQMERECSRSQRRCAEQAQQLLQAEGLCRDLKSRLNRQQRNTLQFKAALEKSLEMSVTPANFELPDLEVEPIDSPDDFFPRSKPVKPWSQQQQDEDSWVELEDEAIAPPEEAEFSTAHAPAAEVSSSSEHEALETVFDPVEAETLTETLKTETESLVRSRDLEKELEEELAEEAQETQSASPQPAGPERPEASPRISFVPPIVPKASIPSPAGFVAACVEASQTEDEASPDADTNNVETDVAEKALVTAVADASEEAAPESEELVVSAANWPSPLVNPVRTTKKKIGSLAAIDLPSFPKSPV